jgi:hypothetical protein
LKAGRSELGTIDKQADRLALRKFLQIHPDSRIGDLKRGHSPDRFARDPEWLPAGGK